MSFDTVILILSLLLEAALVILLAYRKVWRDLPIFCLYALWLLVNDSVSGAVTLIWNGSGIIYGRFYLAQTTIDLMVDFLVLVELGVVILRRGALFSERDLRWIVATSLGLLGWLSWMVADLSTPRVLSPMSQILFRMSLSMTYLTIVCVASLAVCSKSLSIGWKDMERRIARGLGTLGLIEVLVSIVHSHQIPDSSYHLLDQVVSLCYGGVLVYWIMGLAQYRKSVAFED